jgi:hypothetical protein
MTWVEFDGADGRWIPSDARKQRGGWAVMGAIARGLKLVGDHDFMDTIWKADESRT